MKRLDSRVLNFLATSRASLMATFGGMSARHMQLEHALAQDIAVDHRHPIELPVLGELDDDLVDLLLVELGPAHERLHEGPDLDVHRMARPELVEIGLGARRLLQIQLVEEL